MIDLRGRPWKRVFPRSAWYAHARCCCWMNILNCSFRPCSWLDLLRYQHSVIAWEARSFSPLHQRNVERRKPRVSPAHGPTFALAGQQADFRLARRRGVRSIGRGDYWHHSKPNARAFERRRSCYTSIKILSRRYPVT